MKKLFILLIVLTLSCGKRDVPPDVSFSITNSLNSFEYEIEIIRSHEGLSDFAVFVLDSDDLLPIINEELGQLSISKAINLISINTKENTRVRDYTPSEINGEESGRADEFFQFINDQLIPELHSRVLLDSLTRRAIIGHSIGGLAASYAFTNHTEVFSDYIILSPSLFWDDFRFFEIESNRRQIISQNKSSVFVGIGENEDFGITNGFHQFTDIIEDLYPNVKLLKVKASGSHFGSRGELINQGLSYIIQ